jgi:hypothetical protein
MGWEGNPGRCDQMQMRLLVLLLPWCPVNSMLIDLPMFGHYAVCVSALHAPSFLCPLPCSMLQALCLHHSSSVSCLQAASWLQAACTT